MHQNKTRKEVSLEWITPKPTLPKKTAMLVPQFNESSNFNMLKRLKYFQYLALNIPSDIDIILIDDGSTDNSLEEIKTFVAEEEECGFYVASVYPNTNKVGALYITTLQIEHDLIILLDFDTDIHNCENISVELAMIANDESFMGGYFRMLPYEGKGNVFLFQQIEYSLARSLYKFHNKDKTVPVMPGAGSCYKRELLVEIFEQHSGLRSGEDRESTLLGLKLGYTAKYIKTILVLTRPPLTLKALIKQRVRWNLGYIETFAKEKKYYFEQAKSFTSIGQRSIYDFCVVIFLMLFPVILGCSIFSLAFFAGVLLATYGVYLFWCLALILLVPAESLEFKKQRNLSVLIYPVFKFIVDYLSWAGALILFYKKNRKMNSYYKKFVLKQLFMKDADVVKRVISPNLLYSETAK